MADEPVFTQQQVEELLYGTSGEENPGLTAEDIAEFFRTKNSVSTGKGSNSRALSVFDLGYIPTSKAADFNALTTGFFTIHDVGAEALKKLGLNGLFTQDSASGQADGTFWQIIVTDLQEEHEETYALHNTISDNVMVFATGAKPVSISIRGYVLISDSDDHNYLLLRNYVDYFRARNLSAKGIYLIFTSQDTCFKLIIESINLSHTVEQETYVGVTFSGLAYDYQQSGSFERLYLSYDGKTRRTPAHLREEKKEDEEDQEKEKKTEQEPGRKAPYANPSKDPGFVGPVKPAAPYQKG